MKQSKMQKSVKYKGVAPDFAFYVDFVVVLRKGFGGLGEERLRICDCYGRL